MVSGFFPLKMTPFAYNETLAGEYFPLSREEVLKRGLKWREPEPAAELPTQEIPDDIHELDTNEDKSGNVNKSGGDIILKCEETGKPFRIIPLELKIYNSLEIAVTRINPDSRRESMISKRNPRQLWERQCMKCSKDILTSYTPEKPDIIYCEKCYMAQVY